MSLALAPRRGVSMLGLIMPIWGPKPFPQVSPWHLLKGVRANARPRPPLLKLCGELPLWPLPLLCLPPSPLRLRRPLTDPVLSFPLLLGRLPVTPRRVSVRGALRLPRKPARSLLCLDLRCRMLPVSPLLRRAEKVTVLTRSVATGLARMSGTDATEADLKPGGRLQGYLRCEAAKWIRGHPELYGGSEAAARFPGCYHRCLGRHSVTLRAGSCAQSAAPCLLLCAYC